MEKYGKSWENGRFSARIWPDWGNPTRADMAGLGSIGLRKVDLKINDQTLDIVDSYKYLGLILDGKLSFQKH